MNKTEGNSWAILCLGSTILNFMISGQNEIIFPRDRIVHVLISFAIWTGIIYLISRINFSCGFYRCAIICILILRVFCIIYDFTGYYHIYHGSDTAAILTLTAALLFVLWRFDADRIKQLYIITLFFNTVLFVLIFVLNIGNLNVANIYSNGTEVVFSLSKIYVFFDIFTLTVIVNSTKERVYVQKRYMLYSAVFIVAITLLQGLCIKGNMMYSITPLQSLFQIYSGNTVKRVDYYLAIVQSVNYFTTVSMYIAVIKKALIQRKETINEKI